MSRSDLYMKVVARTVILASLALNIYLVPGVHGSLPLPAPGLLVFLQELSLQERRASLDNPAIPILPELAAIAGVTLLWAKLAKGEFLRGAWIAYLLASVAGTSSRMLVPTIASQRWLPFADLWLVPSLVIVSIGLLLLAARAEAQYAASPRRLTSR
jgi:hypothetical protein